jgi:hypothetical protein
MSKKEIIKNSIDLSNILSEKQIKLKTHTQKMIKLMNEFIKISEEKTKDCVDRFNIYLDHKSEASKEFYYDKRHEVEEDLRILTEGVLKLANSITRRLKKEKSDRKKLKKINQSLGKSTTKKLIVNKSDEKKLDQKITEEKKEKALNNNKINHENNSTDPNISNIVIKSQNNYKLIMKKSIEKNLHSISLKKIIPSEQNLLHRKIKRDDDNISQVSLTSQISDITKSEKSPEKGKN